MVKRRKTRSVRIGCVRIGSGHPIAIQSMLKTQAKDIEATRVAADRLADAGCEIVRIAVEDQQDAAAIKRLKRYISMPLVADIHFDYRLALTCVESGADKIRLNPGNIFRSREVEMVIDACRRHRIPIRIGANSGSLRVSGQDAARSLVNSVMQYLKIFRKKGFEDLVISLKGSSIPETVAAYEKIAALCDYPLHVGITATGLPLDGVVKSSVGIGMLLFQGIGDTIRASLLDDPVQEVRVARFLLSALHLRHFGPEMVCCPTCGRCEVDLRGKAERFQDFLSRLSAGQLAGLFGRKIALMGCVVNGPGEAKEADWGCAFSKQKAALFRQGKIVATVPLAQGERALFEMVKKDLSGGRRPG